MLSGVVYSSSICTVSTNDLARICRPSIWFRFGISHHRRPILKRVLCASNVTYWLVGKIWLALLLLLMVLSALASIHHKRNGWPGVANTFVWNLFGGALHTYTHILKENITLVHHRFTEPYNRLKSCVFQKVQFF